MKRIIIITISAVIVILAGIFLIAPKKISLPAEGKKRICPDRWYENMMPSIGEKRDPEQYFIISGERKELEDFDVEWIKSNCAVSNPEKIY